jgi:hypothetical protein
MRAQTLQAARTLEGCRGDVLLHVALQQRQHVADVGEGHICGRGGGRVEQDGWECDGGGAHGIEAGSHYSNKPHQPYSDLPIDWKSSR